jgi:hypothetical protein
MSLFVSRNWVGHFEEIFGISHGRSFRCIGGTLRILSLRYISKPLLGGVLNYIIF